MAPANLYAIPTRASIAKRGEGYSIAQETMGKGEENSDREVTGRRPPITTRRPYGRKLESWDPDEEIVTRLRRKVASKKCFEKGKGITGARRTRTSCRRTRLL